MNWVWIGRSSQSDFMHQHEIAQGIVAEFTKMLKTLILTKKSNQSDFRKINWLFYVYMYDVCNEK